MSFNCRCTFSGEYILNKFRIHQLSFKVKKKKEKRKAIQGGMMEKIILEYKWAPCFNTHVKKKKKIGIPHVWEVSEYLLPGSFTNTSTEEAQGKSCLWPETQRLSSVPVSPSSNNSL